MKKKTVFLAGLFALRAVVAAPVSAMPAGAKIYLAAQLEPAPGRVFKVVFYEVPHQNVGIEIQSTRGEQITGIAFDAGRVGAGTGVTHLREGTSQLLLVGQVGAKTNDARLYSFQNGRLEEIGRWGGWGVETVQLRGHALLVYKMTETSLPQLHLWRDGKFVDVSDQYPEFYAREIAAAEDWLKGDRPFPTHVFVHSSCKLGAQALLYGRRYVEARALCQKAYDIVQSGSRLVYQGSTPEEKSRERDGALEQIAATLQQVAEAEQRGETRLPK